MGDEDPCLAGERARRTDHLLEDVLAHVRVHRGEGVVQDVEVCRAGGNSIDISGTYPKPAPNHVGSCEPS